MHANSLFWVAKFAPGALTPGIFYGILRAWKLCLSLFALKPKTAPVCAGFAWPVLLSIFATLQKRSATKSGALRRWNFPHGFPVHVTERASVKPRPAPKTGKAPRLLAGAFVFLAGCAPAVAGTALVTWVNPVSNVPDAAGVSTPIPASGPGSLVSARVEWGACDGAAMGARLGSATIPMPVTSARIDDIAPRPDLENCFRVFVTNTYGIDSDASNVAHKIFDAPKPGAPVLNSTVAYTLKPGIFGFLRLAKVKGVRLEIGAGCDAPAPGLPGYCVSGNYFGRL